MNTQNKIILAGSLLIIGFYLITEHRAHLLGNAQYLLFTLFIAMHFFMHKGHGGYGSHDNSNDKSKKGGHH